MGRYETAGNDLRARPSDAASPEIPLDAVAAMAASQPRLDRDPVALLETPSARRLSADFLDHADRLMPRHDRQLQAHAVELAVVLVDVAAANSARLDAHQGVVVADSGQLELLDLVAPVAHLYDGTCLRHSSSLPGIRRPDESGDFPCVSFLHEALTIVGGMPLRQSSSNRVQKPRPGGEKGKRLERWAQVFANEFCCEAWH